MRAVATGLIGLAAALAAPAPAVPDILTMPPGAHELTRRISELGSYELPVGVYADGEIPSLRVEGRIERVTWRIESGSATTLQILGPLRAELEAEGYEIILDCVDRECGGFDFRFGTEVVPAPDMQVDIRDYRFVSAMIDPTDVVSLLVSKGGRGTYVQMIHAVAQDAARPRPAASPSEATLAVPAAGTQPGAGQGAGQGSDLADRLVRDGHAVLSDLDFGSGATRLGPGPFASLEQLADFLSAHPNARIALVGHTDTVGSLAENIAVSRRRAEAVRDRLAEMYDIDPTRIDAEGMGYLAPLASNLTREGRQANRRVEVVLLRLE